MSMADLYRKLTEGQKKELKEAYIPKVEPTPVPAIIPKTIGGQTYYPKAPNIGVQKPPATQYSPTFAGLGGAGRPYSPAFEGLRDKDIYEEALYGSYSPAFAGLGGAPRPLRPHGYFPQYDPSMGYTPQRPGGGLGPIIYNKFGGAVPEGERMIPLATEAGDVTLNILRTYGRNAAINTEVGRSLLPGSIRNNVAMLLPWQSWGYDSFQALLKDMNYTEIPGTDAWVKNDEISPTDGSGYDGSGYDGGGTIGGGGGSYKTVVGGGARKFDPALINWRI